MYLSSKDMQEIGQGIYEYAFSSSDRVAQFGRILGMSTVSGPCRMYELTIEQLHQWKKSPAILKLDLYSFLSN